MFGFLKPQQTSRGPVDFRCEVVIARPSAEVYALIDWADPRNAKRQLGNDIKAVAGEPGRFRMLLHGLPGHRFEIAVFAADPHAAYAFTCEAVPMIGRLVRSRERYGLAPLTAQSCRLTLEATATFVDGMRMKTFREGVRMMAVACHNALAKLKLHAEEGVEAVRDVEDRVIV